MISAACLDRNGPIRQKACMKENMNNKSTPKTPAPLRLKLWKTVKGKHRSIPIYKWRGEGSDVHLLHARLDRRRLFSTPSRRRILKLAGMLANTPPLPKLKFADPSPSNTQHWIGEASDQTKAQ